MHYIGSPVQMNCSSGLPAIIWCLTRSQMVHRHCTDIPLRDSDTFIPRSNLSALLLYTLHEEDPCLFSVSLCSKYLSSLKASVFNLFSSSSISPNSLFRPFTPSSSPSAFSADRDTTKMLSATGSGIETLLSGQGLLTELVWLTPLRPLLPCCVSPAPDLPLLLPPPLSPRFFDYRPLYYPAGSARFHVTRKCSLSCFMDLMLHFQIHFAICDCWRRLVMELQLAVEF